MFKSESFFFSFLFLEIQMPELLYKSLAAKLVVGMPFKVYSYSIQLIKRLLAAKLVVVAVILQFQYTMMLM